MKCTLTSFLFIMCFAVFIVPPVHGQTAFDRGLNEFNKENFEEALPYFLEAVKTEPASSRAAYYSGLTYKVMERHTESIQYLTNAATLTPRVDEAIVELIDVLYYTDNIGEAEKWIAVAERDGINPARVQFLKGLILLKTGRPGEAIAAFENAKRLDPRLTQQAELQIASAYAQQGKLKEAQDRLRSTITLDPASDLALFARDYEKVVSDRMERERPWRFSIGMAYKYDTNVIVKGSGPLTDSVSGQEDSALNFGLRIGYTAPFSFRTPYSLSVYYTMYADRYFGKMYTRADGTRGNLTEYNNMTNQISVVPAYSFGRWAVSLPVTYSYISLQGVKGNNFYNELNWAVQTRYLQYTAVSPTLRFIITPDTFGEVFLGYMRKRYFDTELHPEPPPEEERSGTLTKGGLGWNYSFKENKGLFTVRYSYAQDNTHGRNWVNSENRFGVDLLYPIMGTLRAQASAEAIYVKYRHENTFFAQKRRDDIYNVAFGLIYGFIKNTDLILQYNHYRNQSNIALYDYKREVYTMGVEYRF